MLKYLKPSFTLHWLTLFLEAKYFKAAVYCLVKKKKQASFQNSCWPSKLWSTTKALCWLSFRIHWLHTLGWQCSLISLLFCQISKNANRVGGNEYLLSWLTLLSCGPVTWLFSMEEEWTGGSPDPVLGQASVPTGQKTKDLVKRPKTTDSFQNWSTWTRITEPLNNSNLRLTTPN